jgi:MFS family permease
MLRLRANNAASILGGGKSSQGVSLELLMAGLVATVLMATMVVGPFYLNEALRLSPLIAGFALAVGPVVVAIAGYPSGKLVDRFGSMPVARSGLFLLMAGTLGFALAQSSAGIAGYIAPIVLITSGYAAFQTANNVSVMRAAGASKGAMSGLLNLSRNLGLITGASLMGAIFNLAAKGHQPANVAVGFRTTFTFALVLVIATLAMTYLISKRQPLVPPVEPVEPLVPETTSSTQENMSHSSTVPSA